MAIIRVETGIAAPPDLCFDLARSVDVHVVSAGATGERAVAGKTSGLLNLNDEVTWRGRHFGWTRELTSRISAFDRPRYFRDEMVRGPFRRLSHDHHFDAIASGTMMRDAFEFAAPSGFLAGWPKESHALISRYTKRPRAGRPSGEPIAGGSL